MAKLNFNQITGGGNNNLLINGASDIWQRGTSQTANGYGSDDRWYNNRVGSTFTVSRSTWPVGHASIPDMRSYYKTVSVTSVAGAGNLVLIGQKIEDVRTAEGQDLTVSWWGYEAAAKTLSCAVYQNFGTGGSAQVMCGTEQVTMGTDWEYHSVTFSVPSIYGKTVGADSNLYVVFWLDAGSTYNSHTDSLGQQSGTWGFAKVKAEVGSVATPFVHRPVEEELALCQRYYLTMADVYVRCPANGTITSFSPRFDFPVTMRAAPTMSHTNLQLGNATTNNAWFHADTGGATYDVETTATTNTAKVQFDEIQADAEL